MTIGEIPVGQSFTPSALGGVRYTVLDHCPALNRRLDAGLTRCSFWNEWAKTGAETSFAGHLEAHPCAPGEPAGDPPTTPAAEV